MKLVRSLICAVLFVACGGQIDSKWLPHTGVTTLVVLQPLYYTGKFLPQLKDSIPKYYPVSVTIASGVNLPLNAWYAPRARYKADTILSFLSTIKPAEARIITGITDKDISTRKGTNADYGIMGLGLQPGYTCVVSTFRLQKGSPNDNLLFQRLLKTVLHEIGHNFGLPHCANKHCLMADAEGTLNQDNETGLCDECKSKLGLK